MGHILYGLCAARNLRRRGICIQNAGKALGVERRIKVNRRTGLPASIIMCAVLILTSVIAAFAQTGEDLPQSEGAALSAMAAGDMTVTTDTEMPEGGWGNLSDGVISISGKGVIRNKQNMTSAITDGSIDVDSNAANSRKAEQQKSAGSVLCATTSSILNLERLNITDKAAKTMVVNLWENSSVVFSDVVIDGAAEGGGAGDWNGAPVLLGDSNTSIVFEGSEDKLQNISNAVIKEKKGQMSFTVKSGSTLTIDNCSLTYDGRGPITVEAGSELVIDSSEMINTSIENHGKVIIRNDSVLKNCVISNSSGSTLDISDSVIRDSERNKNQNTNAAPMINGTDSEIVIKDTEICNNRNYRSVPSGDLTPGPSIISLKGGSVSMTNVYAHDNGVNTNGGVMHAVDTEVTVKDSTFINNTANNKYNSNNGGWYGKGGAFFIEDDHITEDDHLTIDNTVFRNNRAAEGGAVDIKSEIPKNENDDTVIPEEDNNSLSGSEVTGSDAGESSGGHICAATISASTFEENKAARAGGALIVWGNGIEATIQGCDFRNNEAGKYGGAAGIFLDDDVKGTVIKELVTDSGSKPTVFEGNKVTNGSDFAGGALHINRAYVKMQDAAIYDNYAQDAGGGVSTCSTGSARVHVLKGAAIFDNDIGESSNFRDPEVQTHKDVYYQTKDHIDHNNNEEIAGKGNFPAFSFELFERMFNGGVHNWNTKTLEVNTDNHKIWSFIAQSDPTVKDVGSAKVIFRNNEALRANNSNVVSGGAIGCNGLLEIGTDEQTEIKVVKIWDDGNDADRLRPDAAEFVKDLRLFLENKETEERTPISLPTVSINSGAGEGQPYASGSANGINVDVFKSGSFMASGNLIDSSDVSGSSGISDRRVVAGYDQETGLDKWVIVISGLPVTENGVYVVGEEEIFGYACTSSLENTNKGYYELSNEHEPDSSVSVSGRKLWRNDSGNENQRPRSITVHLMADGKFYRQKTVSPDSNGNWSWTFEGLPKYSGKGEEKKEIVYTFAEGSVADYYTTYDHTDHNIINTYDVGHTGLTVLKHWDDSNDRDGIRPDSVEVTLLRRFAGETNYSPVPDTAHPGRYVSLTLNESSEWEGSFEDLPLKVDGRAVEYSVREAAVSGYTLTLDESHKSENILVLKNKHEPEMINLSGEKIWDDADNKDGIRPGSIKVNLYSRHGDNEEWVYLESQNVSAADNWAWTFYELNKYHAGKKIQYKVEEEAVRGYAAKTVVNDDGKIVITNTHTPDTVSISGKKTWNDGQNQDGMRPASITVRLLANGRQLPDMTRQVGPSDGWEWKFDDLPAYSQGEKIVYTVTEDAVPGYSVSYDGSVITNTRTPGKTSVTVTKSWSDRDDADGKRPSSVTVKLFADGADTGKTLVLNKENNWTGSFRELDENAGGRAIVYTVEEVPVPGYESVVTGDQSSGYVITNTHEPEKSKKKVPVSKVKKGSSSGKRVKTGDSGNIMPWLALIAAAAAGIGAICLRRRARR